MKSLLYLSIFILFTSCNWWKNCETCFIKEKKSKSKSTVFSKDVFIETKQMYLFSQLNRSLHIKFNKNEGKNYVIITQLTNTDSFKNAFVLGSQIKIGFVFDNKQTYVLTFASAENKNKQTTSYEITSNQCEIENTFSDLLKNQKIISLEVQNPFLNNNESKVKQWDVPTGEKINKIYNCFLLK